MFLLLTFPEWGGCPKQVLPSKQCGQHLTGGVCSCHMFFRPLKLLSSLSQSHTDGAFPICVVIKNSKEVLKSFSTFLEMSGSTGQHTDGHLAIYQLLEDRSTPDTPTERNTWGPQWSHRRREGRGPDGGFPV